MLRHLKSRAFWCATPGVRNLSHLPIDDELFGLSAEQREFRATFRNFFETELGPHAKSIDDNDDFPDAVFKNERTFLPTNT